MKKILFLHGFMGSSEDSHFLKSLPVKIFAPSLIDILEKDSFDSLYDYIDEINPDFLYGYSMGGRLALDYLAKRIRPHDHAKALTHVILESSALFNLSSTDKRERLVQDQSRAHQITSDFPAFLSQWYELPLWGNINESTKAQWIKERIAHNQIQQKELAYLIENLSPARFDLPKFSQLPQNLKYIYFYGEEDLKYSQMIKDSELPKTLFECFCAPNSGHNIHRTQPDYILNTLNHLLTP